MVIDPLVVVEVPKIIVEREIVVRPQYDRKTAKLFEQLRYKKGELLKKLEMGEKEERKKAIDKLAGFSFDEKVRGTLEHILASDPDPELRKEVAESVAKVKNREVLPALEKARVEDTDKEVREEADKAIKKIKGS
ncbi:MAG: HEAT repeat domain-containing protein [Planctomycetota bacterium]|nr:HEAT repeat domain-containing protein [Planctomycetota bacterium]